MKPRSLFAVAGIAVFIAAGCITSHVTREIPPPGGCDRCHRQKIAGNWEVAVVPVMQGRAGGTVEPSDIILRDLQAIPYHKEVPTKKLSVYAASAPPEAIGGDETGIQCFICHRTPSPPHEQLRGHHPWDRGQDK